MTRRAARIDIEAEAVLAFDAGMEEFLETGIAEELLRAAALVLGSSTPLSEGKAEIIAELTGCACILQDYDDAGRAVRRWFALMAEPGARH